MRRYSIEEFEHLLKPEKREKPLEPSENKKEDLSDISKSFIINSWLKRSISAGTGRSLALLHLGFDCFGWGIEKSEALQIALKLNEKICEPPEDQKIVEHQIKSAYKYAKGEFGEYKEKLSETKTDQDRQKKFREFTEHQKVREKLKNFVYIAGVERFIDIETGFELTSQTQINNFIAHRCSTSVTLLKALQKNLLTVVERIDFRPDIAERIFRAGQGQERTFNRFRGITKQENNMNAKESKKAIKAFRDHLEYLSTTPEEFQALLNYCAFITQNPGKKLSYATLIISKFEGIGKSLLQLLFSRLLAGYVGDVENSQLGSEFTEYFLDRLVLFVHELSQNREDKHGVMNKLKNRITEKTITINAKHARTYTTQNTVNFFFFSNRPDAVRVSKHDRRLFVIYNEKPPQSQEYYKELVKVFQEGAGTIYDYLLSIDLSEFNPHARPLMTLGKQQLIDQSTSELNIFLKEKLETHEGPFENSLVSASDVLRFVEMWGPEMIRRRTSIKQIIEFLGLQEFERKSVDRRIDGKHIHRNFWIQKRVLEKLKTHADFERLVEKVLVSTEQ